MRLGRAGGADRAIKVASLRCYACITLLKYCSFVARVILSMKPAIFRGKVRRGKTRVHSKVEEKSSITRLLRRESGTHTTRNRKDDDGYSQMGYPSGCDYVW